jgi:myo-inositol-1(or 4)-monophosphatase
MHPMLNTAIRAARRAGDLMLRHLDDVARISVRTKGRNDFVSEVDHMAERVIVDTLIGAYPDHAILAEEGGASGESDHLWIIDPLDGTTNFLHGFPQFAVSIALRRKGRLHQAVVYDPVKQDLFTASRGQGAHLNNRRIRVSALTRLDGALIGTGFPFREQSRLELYIEQFRAIVSRTAGVRRAGSAALDLAYVACGRLDGFWEMGLHVWDIAAGVLLIEEAGGLVGDLDGAETHMTSGDIVAGNPKIFKAMVQALHPHARVAMSE